MTGWIFGVLISSAFNREDEMAVESHILEMSNKHEKIQHLIEAELTQPAWDEAKVATLKKEKLRLKDELERLRS